MTPDRTFWLQIRQALLMAVDAIERALGLEPRTSELRKEAKRQP
jgi:hypothetical protein